MIIQSCLPFLKTPLYLIPRAHPNSKKPCLEWRLSFSLVEKKIYGSIPDIFRKVYILCKGLRIWNGNPSFPNYVLKTVFLWTYEDWQKSKMEFTEDDTLNMILQIFSNFYQSYNNGSLFMYFIPELNLLNEYSKTVKKVFIQKLKALANLQSLSFFICQNSSKPFLDTKEGPVIISSFFYIAFDTDIYLRQPSFYNLWYLYNIKIQKNKDFRNNEDKLEFLHEL